MHPEICPLCQGNGHLDEPHLPGGRRECHGCEGLGWVAVPDGDRPDGRDHALPLFWWQPVRPGES